MTLVLKSCTNWGAKSHPNHSMIWKNNSIAGWIPVGAAPEMELTGSWLEQGLGSNAYGIKRVGKDRAEEDGLQCSLNEVLRPPLGKLWGWVAFPRELQLNADPDQPLEAGWLGKGCVLEHSEEESVRGPSGGRIPSSEGAGSSVLKACLGICYALIPEWEDARSLLLGGKLWIVILTHYIGYWKGHF